MPRLHRHDCGGGRPGAGPVRGARRGRLPLRRGGLARARPGGPARAAGGGDRLRPRPARRRAGPAAGRARAQGARHLRDERAGRRPAGGCARGPCGVQCRALLADPGGDHGPRRGQGRGRAPRLQRTWALRPRAPSPLATAGTTWRCSRPWACPASWKTRPRACARGSRAARRTTPPTASPARSRRSSGKENRRAGVSPARPKGSSPILVEIMARGVDEGAAVRRVCNHLGLAPARGSPGARRTTPPAASSARSRRSSGKKIRRAGETPARPKGAAVKRRCGTPTGPGRPGRPAPPCRARTT